MPYPATEPWTFNAPAKYISCSSMPGCNTTGAGVYNFRLLTMFTDAKIVAFNNGTAYPVAVASSPVLTFTDVDAPFHGHLGRTPDPSEMRVTWQSGHNDDNPTVMWGTTPGGPYPNVAFAESVTYTQDDLCGDPAVSHGWFSPFYHHHALINNLVPGSSQPVYYVYGSKANGFSQENWFLPAPITAASTGPVHIVAIADMGMTELDGSTDHWAEPDAGLTISHVRNKIQGNDTVYSLALHAGDVSYATGYQTKVSYS
jgi:hypothetical protein